MTGSTEFIFVLASFGFAAFGCLGWMLWNLVAIVGNEGLSGDVATRMSQTKQILLKPAVLFFAVGGLSSIYLMLRGGDAS